MAVRKNGPIYEGGTLSTHGTKYHKDDFSQSRKHPPQSIILECKPDRKEVDNIYLLAEAMELA